MMSEELSNIIIVIIIAKMESHENHVCGFVASKTRTHLI